MQPSGELCKCFTFFSWLNKYWRDFKSIMGFRRFMIKTRFPIVPTSSNINLFFSIHSPSTLPLFGKEEFQTLKTGMFGGSFYSGISQDLLVPGFDTNCFKYDLDYKHANYNMPSDCISNCVQNDFSKTHNLSERFHPYFSLYRKEFLENNPKYKFAIGMNYSENYDSILSSCRNKCPDECNINKYITITFYDPEDKHGQTTQMYIQHNQYPDIVIEHKQSLPLLDLVCNLGGLIGMWLGYSFLYLGVNSLSSIWNFLKTKVYTMNIDDNINIRFRLNRKVNAGFSVPRRLPNINLN